MPSSREARDREEKQEDEKMSPDEIFTKLLLKLLVGDDERTSVCTYVFLVKWASLRLRRTTQSGQLSHFACTKKPTDSKFRWRQQNLVVLLVN